TNYDNMVVEIICGDESKKNVTIMAHADVVPAGSGWDQDPFEVKEKDGVFYGRGVADDKGPLLSCYYGLLALKEKGLIDGYHVRFLVGGNEESGSLGMIHYFEELKKKQPDLGFSPDSAYPLTYGEKGIIGFKATKKVKIPHVISIQGGVAHNAVIEKCVVLMDKDERFIQFLKDNKVEFTSENKGNNQEVTFIGKAAHGSLPWQGVNSGLIALNMLGQYYQNEDLLLAYKYYGPTKGEGVHADAHNEEMYDNSLCVGFVNYENEQLSIAINFRYINEVTEAQMIKAFKDNSKPFDIEVLGTSPLLYYPQDSVLISTLMHVYQEETGDYDTKPLTSGGGTYAKEADNVVAFGMEFPGWDALMHSPNERTPREDLVKSMAIYARAIVELGEKIK
ncbi:MAG: Sapep family Mn(2+)-dependent dipeptidase, partial [Bacilli bacterium]|nr:Sapep family Mn(2+)-dependent dipeptidase [Bacilli bacterium]